ncbi:MAG: OmpA family protein, partial [Mucilaginibacter sp.]
MNYSTLKKTVALSVVALLAVGAAKAQTAMSDSAKTTGTAKTFGGLGQYRTWSVGVNLGVTAPSVATGGVNDFNKNKASLGFGLSLRDQLSHIIALQLDLHGGKVQGTGNAVDANGRTTQS